MRLEDLARGVPGAALEGDGNVEVGGIAYDSRRVKPGDLFVAVTGINSDGHSYLAEAIAAGAAAVAVDRPVESPPRLARAWLRWPPSSTGAPRVRSMWPGSRAPTARRP